MKKLALTAAAGVVALVFAVVALGELSGEVVLLHTVGPSGHSHSTRLWLVEQEGSLWLRAGARAVRSPGSWYARLIENPTVELERSGVRRSFRATPSPETRALINAKMREAYGLPDRLIGLFRDPASSIPIRLEPQADGNSAIARVLAAARQGAAADVAQRVPIGLW